MMIDPIERRYEWLSSHLNERQRRLWAGTEALVVGYGGITRVARATGLSRGAIAAGCRELRHPEGAAAARRIHRPGDGRKRAVDTDPTLKADLGWLVEPLSRGDPDAPLRWTCKSTRQAAGDQQMEPDRTSAVLLHQPELARQALGEPCHGGAVDRGDHHPHESHRAGAIGY